MKHRVIYPDGTPFPDQACLMPDHNVDTFTVSIRSLRGVSPERLRTLLQTQLEVTAIEWVERVTVVQNAK